MKNSSLLLVLVLFPCLLFSQQRTTRTSQVTRPAVFSASSGKIVGSIFSDYLYVFQEPQLLNPATGTDGRNQFDIRRATIGYEHSFNRDVTAMVMYDGSSNSLQQGYVEIKNLLTQLDMKMGKMQTLSSETTEKIWQYRSLEATVLDRNGLTNEFDNGVSFTGRVDRSGTAYGGVAVYNGTGGAETNKLKKFGLALGNWFDRGTVIEVYSDFENVGNGRSTITAKILYGLMTTKYAFGFEGFYRMNRKFAGTNDVTPAGGSIFTWFEMTKNLRGVVRIDAVDNDLNNSNLGYREIYVNAGLDYMPIPDVHLIPNIIYGKQLKKGSTVVKADMMMARLTAVISFSSMK